MYVGLRGEEKESDEQQERESFFRNAVRRTTTRDGTNHDSEILWSWMLRKDGELYEIPKANRHVGDIGNI